MKRVSQDEVIEPLSEWAASLYEDGTLEVADIEFRIDPLRFWLVRFKKAGTDEEFYAVVMPDGTIVEPVSEDRI